LKRKILEYLKKISFLCLAKKEVKIKEDVSDDEVIVRTLFSELVKKSDGKIRANAFKSYPKDADTVSVTRLGLTNLLFVKKFSLTIKKANYCGLASIFAKNIFKENATIVFSPTNTNPYHADIKIGYNVLPGQTLPAEYSERIANIADKSKYHKDDCPKNELKWCGDKTINPIP